jgi:hypothetical protein
MPKEVIADYNDIQINEFFEPTRESILLGTADVKPDLAVLQEGETVVLIDFRKAIFGE